MQVGNVFTHTFQVTQSVYEGFQKTFNDFNPLHTYEDVAKQKGFEGKVMHGNILNGFLSYFIGEGLPMKDVIIHSQSISFHKPVYLNDKLHFRAEVTDYSESVKVVVFSFFFENEAGKKVAKGKIQIGLTA
ncbi:MaoC/PaaZ C-terminal domain-containing protein [Rufibacter soli]